VSRRLFFALWPDEALRRRLADWQQAHLPPGVQPTHPADLHLTLHFLGQVEEGRLGALRELGDRLAGEAFALRLDHLGHWPGPRVLWTAPDRVPEALRALHVALGEGLAALGFALDPRPWRPHVTLARKVVRAPGDLPFAALDWSVREWALLESRPGSRPLYHPLARWCLPTPGR